MKIYTNLHLWTGLRQFSFLNIFVCSKNAYVRINQSWILILDIYLKIKFRRQYLRYWTLGRRLIIYFCYTVTMSRRPNVQYLQYWRLNLIHSYRSASYFVRYLSKKKLHIMRSYSPKYYAISTTLVTKLCLEYTVASNFVTFS